MSRTVASLWVFFGRVKVSRLFRSAALRVRTRNTSRSANSAKFFNNAVKSGKLTVYPHAHGSADRPLQKLP